MSRASSSSAPISRAPAWMPPAWRRLVLIGYGPRERRRLAPVLAGAAEDAVIDHARTEEIGPDLGGGTLLVLAPKIDGSPGVEWLRALRSAGHRTPALLLLDGANDAAEFTDPPWAELSPFDVMVDPDNRALRRSLGFLRQSVADQRLADDILRRLQAYDAAGSDIADVARVMEIARGLRAQLDEKEAEVEHLAARCESLQSRLDEDPLKQRVRELQSELHRSEELRKGQELAMGELRRRQSEIGGDEATAGQGEVMARLLFSEWMRSSQQQQLQYLQQRLDERDGHFQALATLLEATGGDQIDPDQLLEAVAARLVSYEREKSERRDTIARMSHSVAAEPDEALDEAQTRRNALQRLDDAMAYARRFQARLACLLISIDAPGDLRRAHGSVSYDFLVAQLAQRLKVSLRQHDVLVRYDGDSFLLISDTGSTAGAHTHAARLIDQVASQPIQLGNRALRPSVSIAIVLRHPLMHNSEDFVARAQKVLAKGRGKWGPGHVAVDPRSVRQEKEEPESGAL